MLPTRALAIVAVLAAAAPALAAGGAAAPLPPGWLPNAPYMSNSGADTMHSDAYASDTHPWSGPVGRRSHVTFAAKGACAGLGVTREKLLMLQCGGVTSFTMRLVDPVTLKDLATYSLPPRPSTLRAAETANLDTIYSDSSGAYFYLDDRDRVVVADAAQHVQRVAHVRAANGTWTFRRTDDWDLSRYLPHDCATFTNPLPQGQCDPLTGVLPDWNGRLWWVSRYGRVGTIDPRTGRVRLVWLRGEQIENSHAVSEDGVSIVSDHALYQFRAGRDGTPRVVWREAYDRGSARKPGQINQGSGTTPTFLGKDYVAITDNADDRMHVLVYRRADHVRGRRLVCAVPVFGHGHSATENSLVGWGNRLVVENNFGYHDPTTMLRPPSIPGGLTAVDVGPHGCRVAWTNSQRSPSAVPKVARGNGMLYVYTFAATATGADDWFLTVVDVRTGRTVAKIRTGTGPAYDNAWGPITIGPDSAAYVSCFGGLLAVRDG